MRIGASIIFQNGYCFQSYNWKLFRPLGTLNNVIRFLDRYEVDEISITRPIRSGEPKKNFIDDINKIKMIKHMKIIQNALLYMLFVIYLAGLSMENNFLNHGIFLSLDKELSS